MLTYDYATQIHRQMSQPKVLVTIGPIVMLIQNTSMLLGIYAQQMSSPFVQNMVQSIKMQMNPLKAY